MAIGDKRFSQLDPGQIIKDVHDYEGHSINTKEINSKVPGGYSYVTLTYNSSGSVTKAKFYRGIESEKTRITTVADVAGSLNDKYLYINGAEDATEYYVWFNVDGLGTDPFIVGKNGVEIPLQSNDSDYIVATALLLALGNKIDFETISVKPNILDVENTKSGSTTDAVDVNTGFTFDILRQGETELMSIVEVPEISGVRYLFNEVEGKFELVADIQGSVAILGLSQANPVAKLVVNELSWTPISVSVPDGTTVALNIQNESASIRVRQNYTNTAPANEGMLIAANLGERQYVIKKSGTFLIYVRADTAGSATLNIEVIY